MLNSKVIDVDKLDYLIRDAYITGFDTVNIDFERLLSSLTISKDQSKYKIAYYKNAISVIENVVYAHDAERKWIQTHPVVLYEAYILQHIIGYLSEKFDDDIIYLMKNSFHSELCEEFFERRIRRHPVWKSEAEYKAFVLDSTSGGKWLEKFEMAMGVTAMYLIKSTDSWVIDKDLIAKLEKEKEILLNTEMDKETKNVQLKNKEMILKVIHSLEDYADEKGIDCNFVILKASQFNSGFGKPDFSATNIAFQTKEGEKIAAVGKIVSALKAKERDRDDFFYLFYKRKEVIDTNKNDIDNQEICEKLFKDVVF